MGITDKITGRMKQAAKDGVYPKGPDVLRWRYHGLFFVGPTQDSYMTDLGTLTATIGQYQYIAAINNAFGMEPRSGGDQLPV